MIQEKGNKMGGISDCGPDRTACIGLLAHVDAGKTTLSEQLLYHARALRTPGRVDTATAFLDADPIERQRGITIFSGQARFLYRGRQYVLVDTPGHTDFASEMERALAVLDAAVVVVSAAWRGGISLPFFSSISWTGLEPMRGGCLISSGSYAPGKSSTLQAGWRRTK